MQTSCRFNLVWLHQSYLLNELDLLYCRMIEDSLRSVFTQFNFFIHNLGQMKFSSHQEGALLSFVSKTYRLCFFCFVELEYEILLIICQHFINPEVYYYTGRMLCMHGTILDKNKMYNSQQDRTILDENSTEFFTRVGWNENSTEFFRLRWKFNWINI